MEKNIYIPEPAKIISIAKESSDSITLRIPFNKKNMPGQFVQLSIPGIGECPISISSHSDKYLDLHIRIVGNMTKAISKMKAGDTLFMRGPYGNGYPVDNLKGKDILLIGGGCGVAPLRSIIHYVKQNRYTPQNAKDYRKIMLFFGYRSPEEMIFKEESKEWQKEFELYLSFDSNPKNIPCDGEICYVTQRLQNQKISPDNKTAMLCGPPIMMETAIKILKEKGFKEEQIYISTERLMHCAIGLCGHCMIHGKYTCKDGPVFRLDELR